MAVDQTGTQGLRKHEMERESFAATGLKSISRTP
jgi:hypothetical protein